MLCSIVWYGGIWHHKLQRVLNLVVSYHIVLHDNAYHHIGSKVFFPIVWLHTIPCHILYHHNELLHVKLYDVIVHRIVSQRILGPNYTWWSLQAYITPTCFPGPALLRHRTRSERFLSNTRFTSLRPSFISAPTGRSTLLQLRNTNYFAGCARAVRRQYHKLYDLWM